MPVARVEVRRRLAEKGDRAHEYFSAAALSARLSARCEGNPPSGVHVDPPRRHPECPGGTVSDSQVGRVVTAADVLDPRAFAHQTSEFM